MMLFNAKRLTVANNHTKREQGRHTAVMHSASFQKQTRNFVSHSNTNVFYSP